MSNIISQIKTTILHHPLPNAYRCVDRFGPEGAIYVRKDGLKVIETISDHEDGREWLHVSLSFTDHLPTYGDLKQVKSIFAGDENTALQVFPPKSQHINIHEYCLHLWCCLTEDVTPDFGKWGTI